MSYRATLLFFALLYGVSGPSQSEMANNIIAVEKSFISVVLGDKLKYLVEDGYTDLDSLIKNHDTLNWKISNDTTPNFGFNIKPHWFWLDINNRSNEENDLILQIQYPMLDYIDVYLKKSNGEIVEWHTGDLTPFKTRPLNHRHFLFPLELEANSDFRLYFRVESSGAMQIPINLWNERAFFKTVQERSIPHGIFIGLYLVLIIYNFFLFLSTRDSSYLFYTVFALGFLSFFMSISGYGYQYIWSNQIQFQQYSIFTFICATIIGLAEFTIGFLRIPNENNTTFTMLRSATWVTGFIFVLMFILPYKILIQILMLICIYISIISTFVGIRKITEMGVAASIYASGWIIMAIGIMLLVLNKFAIIDANIFTEMAAEVSTVIFSLLLSFALGFRIQDERKNRIIAEKNALISQKSVLQARLKASQIEHQNEQIKLNSEEESRSKNAFLAMMSHEIRTPLNGIMGLSELLKTSKLNDKQKQYADTIYKSGESLLTIINDILDFSKIMAGKLNIESIPVDIFDLANNSASIFSKQLKEKGLSLYINIHPAINFEFKSDPVRLRQVLLNYLSNAIKFTENGNIFVDFELDKISNTLSISVKDSGIGIPKEKQAHLFHAFSQADTSTTRKYGGTGLGLAICNQLSHLMGGEIGCTSTEGVGSTFTFSCKVQTINSSLKDNKNNVEKTYVSMLKSDTDFAFIKAQLSNWGCNLVKYENTINTNYDGLFIDHECLLKSDPDSLCKELYVAINTIYDIGYFDDPAAICKPISTSSIHHIVFSSDQYKNTSSLPNKQDIKMAMATNNINQESIKGSLNGINILIAEDNTVNQMVIKALLNKLGAEYTLVENGKLALDFITNHHQEFDLILMDCEMPIMDGFTASEKIRLLESDQHNPIPIIALTAHAMAAHRELAEQSGMNGFVSKPVKQSELITTIHSALKSF